MSIFAIGELKKQAENRLETLAMYESMLTALGIVCLMVSCGMALWAKYDSTDWYGYAIVLIVASFAVAGIRLKVRAAIAEKRKYLDVLDQKYQEEAGGCRV